MKIPIPNLGGNPRGAGGLLATASFVVCAGLGVWLTGDCIVREGASRCKETALTGAGITLMGAGVKALHEDGFQTPNPALDPYRRREDEREDEILRPEPKPEPEPKPAVEPERELELETEQEQPQGVVPEFLQPFVEAAINTAVERAAERMGAQITKAIIPAAAPSRPKSTTTRQRSS